MTMKAYMFILGVEGFGNKGYGEDVAPVFEYAIYLNRKEIYAQLEKLNLDKVKDTEINKKFMFKEEDEIKLPNGIYGVLEVDTLLED